MSAIGPGANRYSLMPLFLATVVFILLAPVYWLTMELPSGRLIGQAHENASLYQHIYPAYSYSFSRLQEGELPLWNPGQLGGTPHLANPANAVFQPLNAVFYLLHTEKALAAHAFLCLILMGAGTVLLLRGLGARWAPGLIAGIAFACSGATAAGISRPEIAAALAWSPWLLWALREYAREYRFGFAILAGVFSALVWLSGAWAVALVVHAFAMPYGVLRTLFGHDTIGPPPVRKMQGLGLALVVALGISAVQWLPAFHWALTVERPFAVLLGIDFAGHHAGAFKEFLSQLVGARQDRIPRMAYVGILTVVLLPGAFFHPFGKADALLYAAMAGFAAVLSVMGHGAAWGSGLAAATLFPGALALAVLAGLGADRLLIASRDPRSPFVWIPILGVLLLTGLVFAASGAEARGRIIVLLIVLVPTLILRVRWVNFGAAILLSLLLFTDLAIANRNVYQHPFNDAPAVYRQHAQGLKAAEEQALRGRVLISAHPLNAGLAQNLGMITALNVAGGTGLPLTREQGQWWRRLAGPEHLEVPVARVAPDAHAPVLLNYMAVKVVVAGEDSPLRRTGWTWERPRLRQARSADALALYANDDALRRAHWVPSWQRAASFEGALDLLADPDFDHLHAAVITLADTVPRELTAIPQREEWTPPAEDQAAVCAILEDRPEQVVLRVEAEAPGIVVLADTDAPGWRAYLNGRRVPIHRANGLFRGVAVPAGEHELVFVYRPAPVRAGIAAGTITLVLLLLAGLAALLRPALGRRPRRKAS